MSLVIVFLETVRLKADLINNIIGGSLIKLHALWLSEIKLADLCLIPFVFLCADINVIVTKTDKFWLHPVYSD